MSGYLVQEDAPASRELSANFDTVMIARRHLKRFLRLSSNAVHERVMRAPESHYAFLGEVPWADTIGGGEYQLTFQVGVRPRRNPIELRIELRTVGGQRDAKDAKPGSENSTVRTFRYDEEPIIRRIPGIVPAQYVSWESYHTETSPAESRLVPIKEIGEALNLWLRLPRPDMFETNGKRASVTVRPRRGQCCFLRADLLSEYLKSKDLLLVYNIFVERHLHWKSAERAMYAGTPIPHKHYSRNIIFDGSEFTTV